jgi:hypothetical protein
MTGHAALFETDGLAAVRAGFPKEAVFMFAAFPERLIFHISFFKDPADSIRNREDQSVLLKYRMLTPDPL